MVKGPEGEGIKILLPWGRHVKYFISRNVEYAWDKTYRTGNLHNKISSSSLIILKTEKSQVKNYKNE